MGNLLYQIKDSWEAYAKKDYAKAIEIFERVIADGEKNSGIYISLAHCYRQLNDTDTALRYCNEAVELDPNYYQAGNLLRYFLKIIPRK